MNRINKKGMQLIQYKNELEKEYPQLVKDSLMLAVQQLLEGNVIDLDTFEAVKDNTLSLSSFENYLLTKPGLSKTKEEILEEYEVIRKKFDEEIAKYGIRDIVTESIIEKDTILASKKFCIEDNFTMEYFGVEEKDLLKLMKRRGFIEKFAVLRLTTIFKDILNRISSAGELFNTEVSLVYFDKVDGGYNIDLQFEINVDELEKGDRTQEIINKVNEIKIEAERIYKEKTVA